MQDRIQIQYFIMTLTTHFRDRHSHNPEYPNIKLYRHVPF